MGKKKLFPAKCKKQHTPFLSWPGLAWDERPPRGEDWGGPLGEAVPKHDRRQRWKQTPGRGSSENAGFSRGGRAAGGLFLLQPALSVVVLTVGLPASESEPEGGLTRSLGVRPLGLTADQLPHLLLTPLPLCP